MNKVDMTGKVAVVNGASRGIGEAIAKGLAACGAQLVLTSRRKESVQKVADEIIADGGKAVADRTSECDKHGGPRTDPCGEERQVEGKKKR